MASARVPDAAGRWNWSSDSDVRRAAATIRLRLLDVESGVERVLVTSDRGFGTPAFSSDGRRLVFLSGGDIVGATADLDWEVFVVDVSSGAFYTVEFSLR